MTNVFLILLFGTSSVVLILFAACGLRLSLSSLGMAFGVLLEFTGLWLICLVANVAVGVLAILAVRSLSTLFLSIYLVNDVSVVIVSGLQAVLLQGWMRAIRP